MTNNARVLGLGTIIAIVLVYAVAVGVVLGLVGANLRLSAGMRGGLIGGSVAVLVMILMRRRRKALGEHRNG